MIIKAAIGAGIVAGAGLNNQAHARSYEASVSAVADRLMTAHDIPGLALGVIKEGDAETFAFGVASRETGAAVTPETLFELGSVSKVYTATLAAIGYARARLDWSDPVSRYLPELADAPVGSSTLLDLGTYSAGGLPLQFPGTVSDLDNAMAFYRSWRPSAAPGSTRQYSNTSLGLFGRAAAAAMRGDFASLMDREILQRLGLRDTYTQVPPQAMNNYAWGHDRDGNAVRVNPGVFDTEAYGLKATARDVLNFLLLHLAHRSLDPDMRTALDQTMAPRIRIGSMIQCLGWESYDAPVNLERLLEGNSASVILGSQPAFPLVGNVAGGQRLFNKTGSTGGFGAYVAFLPDHGIGVAILANRNFPIPARVEAAWQILGGLGRPLAWGVTRRKPD
ncbi:MAG: beta-lactamase [Rhodospirillales bacterium]|nr:beta-lactamase [Rhodospirillales bacterium]